MKAYKVLKNIGVTGHGLVDKNNDLINGLVEPGATVTGNPESSAIKKWLDKGCIKERQAMTAKFTSKSKSKDK